MAPDTEKEEASCQLLEDCTEPSVRAFSRKHRVYALREFLLETYGTNCLDVPGTAAVLDVAGGKGDLSWLLTNVDGIRSVVLDPRRPNNHIEKSVHYLREHPDECLRRAVPGLPTHQPLAGLMPRLEEKRIVNLQSAEHMRIHVDQELVGAVRRVLAGRHGQTLGPKGENEWRVYWKRATYKARVLESRESLAAQVITKTNVQEDRNHNNNEILDADQALDAILGARLVVGFHPDQATDACIDLAKALDVPFCVVPCCVFPKQFPNRRLKDGRKVKFYHELVEYLREQHPDAQTATLSFHETSTARRIALYTLPRD